MNELSSSVSVIACSSPTDVEFEESQVTVSDFSISQNFPNPFNASTVMQFTVHSSRLTENSPIHTTLDIYNILGQKVKSLVNESKYPGTYQAVWDGKDDKGHNLATGIYLYRLKVGSSSQVKKMLLLR